MILTKEEQLDLIGRGFTLHDGDGPPEGIQEMTRVICAVWTVDGVRFSHICPAYIQTWHNNLLDDEIGSVVGYKLA